MSSNENGKDAVQPPANAALAIRAGSSPVALAPLSLPELMSLGRVLAQSRFFADVTLDAQAVTKIMAGAELGFPPLASMTGIYIIKSRISLSANLIASQIKKSDKYDYRVLEVSAQACEIEFFERGNSIGKTRLTMEEARSRQLHQEFDRDTKALKEKQTWKSFPANMLFARVISNGARFFCPDVFNGSSVYTPDELGVPTNEEGEPIIDVTPRSAPSPSAPLEEQPFQQPCSFEQMEEIIKLGEELGKSEDDLLAWLKVEEWSALRAEKAANAITKLKEHVAKKGDGADAPESEAGPSSAEAPLPDADHAKEKGRFEEQCVRLGLNKTANLEVALAILEVVLPEWKEGELPTKLQYKRVTSQLTKFKTFDDAAAWVDLKKNPPKEAEPVAEAKSQSKTDGEPPARIWPDEEMTILAPERAEQAQAETALGGLFGEEKSE